MGHEWGTPRAPDALREFANLVEAEPLEPVAPVRLVGSGALGAPAETAERVARRAPVLERSPSREREEVAATTAAEFDPRF